MKDNVLQLNQKDTDEINQPYHVVQVPPPPDNRLYNRIYSQLVVSTQSSLCTHLNLLSTLRLTHRLERAPPPPTPDPAKRRTLLAWCTALARHNVKTQAAPGHGSGVALIRNPLTDASFPHSGSSRGPRHAWPQRVGRCWWRERPRG